MDNEITILDKSGCEFGRNVYDKIRDMEAEQKAVIATHTVSMEETKEKIKSVQINLKELEGRLDLLEKKLYWLLGAYMVIGGIIGFFVGKIV